MGKKLLKNKNNNRNLSVKKKPKKHSVHQNPSGDAMTDNSCKNGISSNRSNAMFVDISNKKSNVSQKVSLQDAFLKFREKREREIAVSSDDDDDASPIAIEPSEERLAELRRKFLDQCKKYIGVPYKKKYHKPGSPEFNSKLFLDCCGLVRRAVRDLRKDFGFRIGPWNQAYMYDTLPLEISREEEMKPGDLVFISGVYFDSKMRGQPHNMVHVEVWLGEGIKTVGARWHKGGVQVFDSYQFVSTNYRDMVYHFRSIDTWLRGTCKSFCPQHSWKQKRRSSPSKKSVFRRRTAVPSPQQPSYEQIDSGQDDPDTLQQSEAIDASEEEYDGAPTSGLKNPHFNNRLEAIRESDFEEQSSTATEADDRVEAVLDVVLPIRVGELEASRDQSGFDIDAAGGQQHDVKFISFTKAIDICDAPPPDVNGSDSSKKSLNNRPRNSAQSSKASGQAHKPRYIFTNRPLPSNLAVRRDSTEQATSSDDRGKTSPATQRSRKKQ